MLLFIVQRLLQRYAWYDLRIFYVRNGWTESAQHRRRDVVTSCGTGVADGSNVLFRDSASLLRTYCLTAIRLDLIYGTEK